MLGCFTRLRFSTAMINPTRRLSRRAIPRGSMALQAGKFKQAALTQVLEPDHGYICQAELAGREQPAVASQQAALLVDQHWVCPPELRHRGRDLVDLRLAEVICQAAARDRYRRLLGACFVGKLNLTAEMVRLG